MKKFFNEFKIFISKGNVMDLAVAFIIGASFKAIVTSLVNDVLMPVVSLVIGDQGFKNYKYVITEANETLGIAENAIYYGRFIQSVFDFVIIAFVIFLIVRTTNRVRERLEKPVDVVVERTNEIVEDVTPKVEDILLDIKSLLTPDNKK